MTYAVYDYGYVQGSWAMARPMADAARERMAEIAMHRNDGGAKQGGVPLGSAETRTVEKFNTMDADGDGMISQAEFTDAMMPKPPAPPPAMAEDQSIRAILQGILEQLQSLKANEAFVTEAEPVVETGEAVVKDTAPAAPAIPAPPAWIPGETAPPPAPTEEPAVVVNTVEEPGAVSNDAVETGVARAETAPEAAAEAVAAETGQTGAGAVATAVTEIATEEGVEDQFETLLDILEDGEETGVFSPNLSDLVQNLYVDVQTILDAA